MCIHYCKGLGRWKDANGEEMAEAEFPGGHEIDITKAEYEGKNGTPPYYQLPIINPNGR